MADKKSKAKAKAKAAPPVKKAPPAASAKKAAAAASPSAPKRKAAAAAAPRESEAPEPRLSALYRDSIVPEMMKNHGWKSRLRVPRMLKITLNMGVGAAVADKKALEHAMGDLEKISGQKPVVTRARRSIAGFKIRAGFPIGCKVTLRGRRMYEFLDRLVTVALPRSRDFRGLSPRAFDGRGNYSLGVREQIIFHEIKYEDIDALRGLDVALSTNARDDGEARELLSALGLPLRSQAKTET